MAQGQLEAQGVGERVARLATQRHAVVGAAADVDEAQRLQDPQRLPHGRPRHAEARRELPFRREPVASRELTVRDRLLQAVEDLLEGPPALHRSDEGGPLARLGRSRQSVLPAV